MAKIHNKAYPECGGSCSPALFQRTELGALPFFGKDSSYAPYSKATTRTLQQEKQEHNNKNRCACFCNLNKGV